MRVGIRNLVVVICILLVSCASGTVSGDELTWGPEGGGPADHAWIDGIPPSHALRDSGEDWYRSVVDNISERGFSAGIHTPGDVKPFTCTDFTTREDYTINATCEAAGEHCYLFVGEDLNVAESRIQDLVTTFDHVVYPTVTETFGNVTGADDNPRIVILLLDIRDDSPDGASDLYVAGYFDGRTENSLNIIFLDVDARDNEIRSTLAHEFQHLIHHSHDPREKTWVDEGCSGYAEFLCFGNENQAKIRAFGRHPDTSLVVTDARWDCSEDEINQAHYGASFLWTLYLAENFGDRSGDPNRSSFLRDLVADSRTGLGGIDATLASHGFLETSEDVFKRWVVANYIGVEGRGPPFGYEGIKLTQYPEVAGRVDFTRQAGAVYTFPEVDLQPWSTAYYEVRAGDPGAISCTNDRDFWMEEVVNQDGEVVIIVSPLRDRGKFVLTVAERRSNLTVTGSVVG